jgi:hypothetical protein
VGASFGYCLAQCAGRGVFVRVFVLGAPWELRALLWVLRVSLVCLFWVLLVSLGV